MTAPKDPVEILKTCPFGVIFQADDDSVAKTNAISSNDLAGSDKSATTLQQLRVLGKLSSKYYFCLPGDKNTISENTSLGSYVSSIKSNVNTVRNAEADNMTALVILYHRSHAVVDPRASLDNPGLSTQPTEMTEHDWNVVLLNNSLLHGLIFDPENQTLKLAREPTFKLKIHHPDRYRRPAGSSGRLQASSSENGGFLAPDFCVADDSSVTITSVRNSLQKSMTEHSFSSWSVEASVSGSYSGFSGGPSASGGQMSDNISKVAKQTTTDLMHASYDFPRVKVFLDANDLEHSDSCKEFCKEQPVDIAAFHKKYGTIFCSSVVLGARLHTTVASSTFVKDTQKATKEEKKAAFALSFSSPFASGSAGGSYKSESDKDGKEKQVKDSKSLNWEARGGETFLATDPTAWINTVGYYKNWRVTERGDMGNILDVLRPAPLISAFVDSYCKIYFVNAGLVLNHIWLVKCPSPYAPGVSMLLVDGSSHQRWLDVVQAAAHADATYTSSERVWEVKTASQPESFFFCISDSQNFTKLALEVIPSTSKVVVNPFDPAKPNQVCRLLKVQNPYGTAEATQNPLVETAGVSQYSLLEMDVPQSSFITLPEEKML